MEIECDKITRLLNERLEIHDNNRRAAQDKLSEICYGMRKQIDDFENSINSELEKVFQKEDKRLQVSLSKINESVSLEDLTKAVQRAKAELLMIQSYDIIQDNVYDYENDILNEPVTKRSKTISLLGFTKMYNLKTDRKLYLKVFYFEERKPSIIFSEFTDNGKLSFSFSFFSDDEINVLETTNTYFETSIKIWDKNNNENNAKKITKKYIIGEQQINFVESFKPNTNYCMKMRIEHPENGLSTQWSDEFEFVTPGFKSICVWKECPDDVEEKMKYSIDEDNLRIATKNDGRYYYCTILGNTPLPPNKIISWNIKILKSRKNNGKDIYIGVAPSYINQNEDNNYKKCGWYFHCYDSTLCSGPPHKYKWKEYGPRKWSGDYVHSRDSVGVVMDTTKGELSFVVNGVNLGVAYGGIPINVPLLPCVLLRYEGDSVELVFNKKKK